MDAPQVRPIRADDVARIKAIDQVSFGLNDQYDDDFYATFVHDANLRVSMVERGSGSPLGYALLDISYDPIRLRSIAVHPDHRGAGCGEALLRHVIAQHAGDALELLVDPQNTGAIRLYERVGFAFVSRASHVPGRRVMEYQPATPD